MHQIAASTTLAYSSSGHEGVYQWRIAGSTAYHHCKATENLPPCSVNQAHPNESMGIISPQCPQAHYPTATSGCGKGRPSQLA
eukprot:11994307-Ditylum_brightwellii.AAC.1